MQPLVGRSLISGVALGGYAQRIIYEFHRTARSLLSVAFLEGIREIEQTFQSAGTAHEQVSEVRAQGRDEMLGVEALGENLVKYQQRRGVIPREERVHETETVFVVKDIEIAHHVLTLDVRAAERDRLVKYGQRVTHGPVSLVGDDVHGLIVDGNPLLAGYIPEIPDYVRDAYPIEVVGLAAAQDSRDNLVLLRGGQDENRVGRRFFKCLQEGVEGRLRQHVDLINDIHGIPPDLRRYLHLVHQGLDVIHAVVGRRVKFMNTERAPFLERAAGVALPARIHVRTRIGTVDGLGEDSRRRRLAHAPRAAEQICVRKLAPAYGVLQSARYIVLTDKRFEAVRPVFPG